jgi:hypothetical protein
VLIKGDSTIHTWAASTRGEEIFALRTQTGDTEASRVLGDSDGGDVAAGILSWSLLGTR